jgi:hypothetical protein
MGHEIVYLAPALVLGLFGAMAWAATLGRPMGDGSAGTVVLRHGWLLRGFALFSAFGIPFGITVLVIMHPPKQEGDVSAILGSYALFAVLSGPLLWEAMRFAVAADAAGLTCRSPWRGTRFVAWDELHEVTFSAQGGWYIFRAADGYKFRVYTWVAGVGRLLAECVRRLPPEALSREVLTRADTDYRPLPPVEDGLEKWSERQRRHEGRPSDEHLRPEDHIGHPDAPPD